MPRVSSVLAMLTLLASSHHASAQVASPPGREDCAADYVTLMLNTSRVEAVSNEYMRRAMDVMTRKGQASEAEAQEMLQQVKGRAKEKAQAIDDQQSTPEAFIAEVRACDQANGFPLTPLPPQQ